MNTEADNTELPTEKRMVEPVVAGYSGAAIPFIIIVNKEEDNGL